MKAICIRCWDTDAIVKMELDGTCDFECGECGERFGCQDVRETLNAMKKGWDRLLKWADAYPKDEPAVA